MSLGLSGVDDWSTCETCLSIGRRVAPLGNLRRVYAALLDCEPSADARVCWECAALLRRALHFRLRAARAQECLRAAQPPDAKPASSLGVTGPTLLIEIFQIPSIDSKESIAPKEEIKDDFDFSASDQFQHIGDEDDVKSFTVDGPEQVRDSCALLSEIKKKPKKRKTVKKRWSVTTNKQKDIQHKPKSKVNVLENNLCINNNESKSESMGARQKRGRGRPPSKMVIRMLSISEVVSRREEERNQESFLNAKFKCTRCLRILNKDTHADHVATLHESKTLKWRCDVCELQFETKPSLRRHIVKHFKLYNCTLCTLSGTKVRTMYNHYHIQHVLKRVFNCATCGAKYAQWVDFQEHLRDHKKSEKENLFECHKCGKKFMKKTLIKKHVMLHEKYNCSECGKTYVSKSNLDLHFQRKHTAAPVPSEVYCVECNKQFHTVLAFEGHIKTVHSSKVKVRVPCTACNLTFANKTVLRQHYNYNHLKVTDFHCGPCDKYFYSHDSLNYHKKHVHDLVPLPKKHMCTICGRGFSFKKILLNHIRTHTGERPYKCEHCKAPFAQKTACKQHMKKVHLRIEKNLAKKSV